MTDSQQYGGVPAQQTAPKRPRMSMVQRRVVALIVLVLAVAGFGFGMWSSHRSNPDSAGVNDCVTQPHGNSIKKVGCGSDKAAMRVVGKVENTTQVQVTLDSAAICKPFPTATNVYWKGEIGKPGYVLCLAPVK
jgi:hypothetical protein